MSRILQLFDPRSLNFIAASEIFFLTFIFVIDAKLKIKISNDLEIK